MRIRFTSIVAILSLVVIGFLMACSSKYSSSSNGLVVVPSYGSLVMQSFSLNLGNGHVSQINNTSGPPIMGVPTAEVLDPGGAFAYVIVYQNPAVPGSTTGIASFPLASDGKLGAETTVALSQTTATVNVTCDNLPLPVSVQAPVAPVALTIDSAGKYLFVADGATVGQAIYMCDGSSVTATVPVPGTVSVLTVSGGALSEVPGSPFPLPAQAGGQSPSASGLAVSATAFPVQFASCSVGTPPATENLYVADSANYLLFNYSVDTSTGTLLPQPLVDGAPGIPTGTVPSGVAVDPCNRFVYVSNSTSNNVSAYTICSTISVSNNCPSADFSLTQVADSPFPTSPGDGPGPLAVDPFGNFLYVVDTGSSEVSAFRISSSNGKLTTIGTYATGAGPNSIAIRSDDMWVFVANFTSSSVSQYAITPATGALTPQIPFTTLNNPTGVAVK